MATLLDLLNNDMIRATQEFPDLSLSPVTHARSFLGNYRLAEALSLQKPILHPIEIARTLLARGKFSKAKKVLTLSGNEPDLVVELALENARHLSFEGEWSASLTIVDSILEAYDVAGPSLISFSQIKANALFELMEFSKAQSEYENASYFVHLFPYASARFYFDALGCKLLVKSGKVSEAETLYQKLLERFLKNKRHLNPDHALTLFRLRTYLNRELGQPSRQWARAGYWLARAMGDELYAALGLVECHPVDALLINSEIKTAAENFGRVRKIIGAIEGTEAMTDFATSIKRSHEDAFSCDQLSAPDFLYVLPWNICINFQKLEIKKSSNSPQSDSIVAFLEKNSEFTRKDFFESIWNLPFRGDRHLPIISMALKRFTARTGIKSLPLGQNSGRLKAPLISVIKLNSL